MASASGYIELRCRSAFGFLRGASLPENLIECAAALGATRWHSATVTASPAPRASSPRRGVPACARWSARRSRSPALGALWLLVEDRTGHRNL